MTGPRVATTRRDFIVRGAQLAAVLGIGGPILQACGDDDDEPRPANRSARSEAGEGAVRIYNYADYVNPDVVASFESKYGVKVEFTTFDTDAESITKLGSGAVDVDLHTTPRRTRWTG